MSMGSQRVGHDLATFTKNTKQLILKNSKNIWPSEYADGVAQTSLEGDSLSEELELVRGPKDSVASR